MINLKKKEIFIGVDIGFSSIKAVEIEISPAGGVILKKANIVAKEEGLKKAVAGMAVKSAKTIGVIDCPTTCVRYFTIPKMSGKEVSEAIKWEIKDKASFTPDDVLMDYRLEKIDEAGISKYRVKLAAMPTKLVDDALILFREAGISPVCLLEPPLAIESLSGRLGLNKDETAAVVDIGNNYTAISVIKNGSLRFTRKINSGGAAITKAMIAALVSENGRIELSPDLAEKIKIKYGIPKEMGTEILEGNVTASQLICMIRPAAERMLQQIEFSLQYYSDESSGDKVDSLILVGGGGALKGLTEFLQENLGMPVLPGDPFKDIISAKGALGNTPQMSNIFANAMGAALSEGRGINLLPVELKQKTRRTFKKAAVESVVASVIVSLALTFAGMSVQLSIYKKKIMYGGKELSSMSPRLETISRYERLSNEIAEKNMFMDEVLSGTSPWKEALIELSNRLPKYTILSSLRADTDSLIISGQIVGGVHNREEALSGIISSLEGGIFRNITLLNARIGEDTNSKTEFDIKCTF